MYIIGILMAIFAIVDYIIYLKKPDMEKFTKKRLMITFGVLIFQIIVIFIMTIMVLVLDSDITEVSKVWYYDDINSEKIPDEFEGETQTVAVIDTGLDAELLEKYSERILYKYNVIDDSNDVTDYHGHGTEVTSAIGLNIEEGLCGVAKKCNFIIIKALGDDGKSNNEYLSKAVEYAIDKNATIINISSGGFKADSQLESAIKKATDNNISVVAAAGDYGNKDILYPAAYDSVISVTASDKSGELWDNSNISKDCDIIFPGVDIRVLSNDKSVVEVTGTSLSAALVSGYIARIRDYMHYNNEVLSNQKVLKELSKYVFDYDKYC